ncbi:MAG TPA: phage holin family protein [Myxococcales bacterium]|nr:phage holin family protein [Myxococcales bacterium]
MPRSDPHGPVVSPRDALARLLDGVQTLFREHLALAKTELRDDLRRAGRDVLLSAAGLPPLLVGYLLMMVALALLLAQAIPGWLAFALVALVNLIAGGGLTVAFMSKARHEKIGLPRTGEELRRDKEWIAALGERGPRPPSPQPAAARSPDGVRPGGASLPSGKEGATADLGPRSASRSPGQPVAGATSTPDGEPMTAERNEPLRH